MRLILTDEQRDLAGSVRAFLAGTAPMARVRAVAESGEPYDRDVWTRTAGELGLAGLAVPEAHGGSGAGHAEVAVVMEELGAALTPSPYLASAVLAADLLVALGDEAAAETEDLLPGIASGTTVAAFAHPEPGAPLPSAERAGGGHVLDGRVPRLLNGADADLLLVVADLRGEAGGTAVFAVEAGASGLARHPLTTLDLTRPQARVELAGTPARLLGTPGAGTAAALARALDLASVAVAAGQLGGLRRCLDVIVEYAGLRVQFGRFVGSFQGVKHKLADMHCTLEQAESIVRYAAWTADESPEELPVAAALAQAFVGGAAFRVAKDHLLLHGGIGFTWEHDAHLYYKRAKGDELLLGPPRVHRARLAERLGL
ncbi:MULTISPECIES: acyl-CoA dehydrogenase family protein [Thermomonosporaceae]|uniref:acyl-CoA dehydrogenase family protein n=1 Tax=Thermomonosporaceae TaxID=2012 RepID=UPI00255B17F6|nr:MULTISPECIES: acyl-CoA dehydrogenase family protein [Thermomonosporaceae]MDL4775007.1 acyl-CoA dehydrogenase family protein [Actinomadura xylanilytica]